MDRSDGTKGKETKESKETEFRVTLVDGHEFIRRATGKDQLLKQIQQLLSGGYVRERHEDGSVTFHVSTRVASVTAQRVGTGVNTKKSRGRAAKTAAAQ